MNYYVLMMVVKMHDEKLMRQGRQAWQTVGARRAARTRQTVPAATRGLVIRPAHRLARVAAVMRPMTTGR